MCLKCEESLRYINNSQNPNTLGNKVLTLWIHADEFICTWWLRCSFCNCVYADFSATNNWWFEELTKQQYIEFIILRLTNLLIKE